MQVHIKNGGCLWPENDTRVRDLHSGILVEATWGHIPAPVHFTPSAGSRPADHVANTPTTEILNRINVDNVLQLTTQVLDQWPNHVISLDTENIPWHQSTMEEFTYLRTCLDQELIGVTFYTDGTFRDPVEDEIWGKGSWAVVMLWNMPDQCRVWGGHIVGHTHQPDSAFPVELEGLMCACLWAIQIVAHFSPEIEITFRYDSNEAGRMCQGSALGSTARSLFQLLENWRMPEYIHVKAHSGEPFNEAVDVLACQACAGRIQVSSRHIMQILCQLHEDAISCQWMWLVHKAAWNDPSLPRLDTTTRELIIPQCLKFPFKALPINLQKCVSIQMLLKGKKNWE